MKDREFLGAGLTGKIPTPPKIVDGIAMNKNSARGKAVAPPSSRKASCLDGQTQ